MFGINAAPEINQREISNVLQGITDVADLADDVVFAGKKHRLLEALMHLETADMTLNREKCVFSVHSRLAGTPYII